MESGGAVPAEWASSVSEVLLGAGEIQARIGALGAALATEYSERNPVLVVVLKGSFMFAADLSRALPFRHELEFIRARSYAGAASTGNVAVQGLEAVDLADRHVLVIEDIVDTGLTLKELYKAFQGMGAASVKCCSFLEKETVRRQPDVPNVDYIAFKIPDKFVIGYGLDFNQQFRHLPFVGVFKE